MTAGHWSPSRPGVFFIAKVDGSVEVWDLLDKTHEPSLVQSVSPAPITTIYPFPVSRKYDKKLQNKDYFVRVRAAMNILQQNK